MLFAGTSGFSYAQWKGTFYPASLAGSKMLGYYAQRLSGVELNGSFYRTPPESTLLNWAAQTPAGFRFCMKANRGLTYSAEGFDRVGLAGIFSRRIAALGERLGPVLLQFPPARQKNLALLDSLLTALARPAAAEFRHVSRDPGARRRARGDRRGEVAQGPSGRPWLDCLLPATTWLHRQVASALGRAGEVRRDCA